MNTINYIETASLFTDKKTTMPILGTIALNGRISATDLETSYVAACVPKFKGCFDPKVITALELGAAEFTKATPMIALDEFPVILGMLESYNTASAVSAAELAKQLSDAMVCAGQDDTRYNICAVCLDQKEPAAKRLVTTDGHRLFCSPLNWMPTTALQEVLLPASGIVKLLKVLKKRKNATVEVSLSEPRLLFPAEQKDQIPLVMAKFQIDELETIYMRLVDGQYPNWRQIIRTHDHDTLLSVPQKAFQKALKLVTSVCTDKDKHVRLLVDNATVTLTASSPEHGFSKIVLEVSKGDVEIKGDKLEIGISGKYLLAYLSTLKQHYVKLGMKGNLGPIHCYTDSDDFQMIMPMRFK